jgi:protein SCO1
MLRRALPVLLLAASVGLLAALALGRPGGGTAAWNAAPPAVQALMWPEPQPLPPFEMLTQHGEKVGPALLRGQWSFVFFGYLQCPDVCPTTLHAMREFRRLLVAADPRAERYRFVFVSVDPERDDLPTMAEYLGYFDPAFIGLGGSVAGLQALAGPLAVKYVDFVDDNGHRSIDHTSSVMVVDPRGRAVGALPPPQQPERMFERFERLRRHLGG